MGMLNENSMDRLSLKFANGNTLTINVDSYDMDSRDENNVRVDVFGSHKGISFSYDEYYRYEDGEYEGRLEAILYDEPPVEVGFNSKPLVDFINAESIHQLINRLSDTCHIWSTEPSDIIRNVCPEYESDDTASLIEALKPYDTMMDLAGTTQEGRPDRIEQLHVGDTVTFVREPNNPYDVNAIEVVSDQGSLGHVFANIASFLAPLMDQGKLDVAAKVASMTTRAERSARARKPLLDISCQYTLHEDGGEKKQFAKLTELYNYLKPSSDKHDLDYEILGRYLSKAEINKLEEFIGIVNNAKKRDQDIKDNIYQIITENMETMDDLEEASIEMAKLSSFCTAGDFFSLYRIFGYDINMKLEKILEQNGDDYDGIVADIRQMTEFSNVDEESVEMVADILLNDIPEDACDFAVRQTWKKGEKIHIEFKFLDEPCFALYDIDDVFDAEDIDDDYYDEDDEEE